MFSRFCFYLPAFLLLASGSSVYAADDEGNSPAYLVMDAGYFEAQHRDIPHTSKESFQLGIAYKAQEIGYDFAPIAGLKVNKFGSHYLYGGISWNKDFFENYVFSPSFSVGYYEDAGGSDLGGPLEFRSAVELSYEFDNKTRLGGAWDHISNGNIYDVNPGYESYMAVYSVPFSTIRSLIAD